MIGELNHKHTTITDACEDARTMAEVYKYAWVVASGTYTNGTARTGNIFEAGGSDFFDDVPKLAIHIFDENGMSDEAGGLAEFKKDHQSTDVDYASPK